MELLGSQSVNHTFVVWNLFHTPTTELHLMTMEARSHSPQTRLVMPTASTVNLPFGGSDVAAYFCVDARPSQVGGGVSRAVINSRFGITV